VVNYGAKEAGIDLCLGWSTDTTPTVKSGAIATVRLCDGTFVWDEDFYRETQVVGAVHGAFFYDPYRNWDKRGVINPRGMEVSPTITNTELNGYATASSWKAAYVYNDYTVWNTTVMSLILAGNTTINVETNSCPIEGCDVGSVDRHVGEVD